MSLTKHVNSLLENINENRHDTQSIIHPEINFTYNSINLLIGQRSCGKTYNVFKEIIKLSQLKNHCYTLFIYATDTNNDQTYKKMKNLIKIPTKIISYSQADTTLDDLIECKQAYDQVIEQHLTDQLDETSRKEILDAVGATDFKIKSPHTIVLFDDAMSIFKNKMSPLFKKLFKNRQPRITYFLCLQDIIGLDAAIKSNVDSIYFFGAFNRQKFNLFFYQSSIPIDQEELWSQYVQLAKREALLVKYNEDGTTISVLT